VTYADADEFSRDTRNLRQRIGELLHLLGAKVDDLRCVAVPVGEAKAGPHSSAEPGIGEAVVGADTEADAGYDPDAYMVVKDFIAKWSDVAGGGVGYPQWTKAKKRNAWFRFDPKAPKQRPRIHRADAARFLAAVKAGRVDSDTFELLDTEGADLPSLSNGEAVAEYIADAYARKETIRQGKPQADK